MTIEELTPDNIEHDWVSFEVTRSGDEVWFILSDLEGNRSGLCFSPEDAQAVGTALSLASTTLTEDDK